MNIGVENNLGFDIQSMIMVLIATLIIIFIAKKYFWNHILNYMEKRKEFLANEYQEAQVAKAEGIKYKDQYEQQLKTVKTEADLIVKNAKEEAKQNYNEIVAQANHDATLIKTKAQQEIDFERRTMEKEINNQIKDVAFAAAQKIIDKEIDSSRQQALVDEFIEDIHE